MIFPEACTRLQMSLWNRCKPEARKWASFHLQGNRLKQPRALQMNFQKTPATQRFQMQRCPQPQSSWEAGWTESLKARCGMGFSYSRGGVLSSLFATGFAPVLVCLQGSCPNAIQDQAAERRGPSQAGMIHRRGTRQGLEDCVLQPGGKDAQATARSVAETMCICFEKSLRFSS